jgi:hypothetical protein
VCLAELPACFLHARELAPASYLCRWWIRGKGFFMQMDEWQLPDGPSGTLWHGLWVLDKECLERDLGIGLEVSEELARQPCSAARAVSPSCGARRRPARADDELRGVVGASVGAVLPGWRGRSISTGPPSGGASSRSSRRGAACGASRRCWARLGQVVARGRGGRGGRAAGILACVRVTAKHVLATHCSCQVPACATVGYQTPFIAWLQVWEHTAAFQAFRRRL